MSFVFEPARSLLVIPVIPWPDVEGAAYLADLSQSSYLARPTLKTAFRIIGYAQARYGWFDVAGDQRALFAVERELEADKDEPRGSEDRADGPRFSIRRSDWADKTSAAVCHPSRR